MKKILSLELCLLMVTALFAGCGGSSSSGELDGKWKGTMDYTELMNTMLTMGEDMSEYFTVDEFKFDMTLEFSGDTAKIEVDADSLEDAADNLIEAIKPGYVEMLEDMAEEYGMDVEEAFEGMTVEEYFDANMTAESLVESFGEMTVEGKYKAEDGKLWISEDLDSEIDEDMYETYKLDGDTLTLTGSSEDEANEMGLYPMVFTKVK